MNKPHIWHPHDVRRSPEINRKCSTRFRKCPKWPKINASKRLYSHFPYQAPKWMHFGWFGRMKLSSNINDWFIQYCGSFFALKQRCGSICAPLLSFKTFQCNSYLFWSLDGGLPYATYSVKDEAFFAKGVHKSVIKYYPVAKEAWDDCGKSFIFNGAHSKILQQLETLQGYMS